MEKNIIEVIIERLRKKHGDNGIYALVESWYEHCENSYDCVELWELNGFLWGLEATGFLTAKGADEARNFIIHNLNKGSH